MFTFAFASQAKNSTQDAHWHCGRLILFVVALLPLTIRNSQPTAPPERGRNAQPKYGQLPMSFEANRGQLAGPANFLARVPGYRLSLTATEAVMQWSVRSSATSRPVANTPLRMQLSGADPTAQGRGEEELPGRSHYFNGNDPTQWRTDVPTYARVKYAAVYPGIDVVYYGKQRQLEYDFLVAPGADPRLIRLHFEGADQLTLTASGDLVLSTESGELRQHKPVAWQDRNGTRHPVEAQFLLTTAADGKQMVGFQLGDYDPCYPLVIDPFISYSTYLGGTNSDAGYAIALDTAGNAYITGETSSARGGFGSDVLVAKLNSAGDAFVYAVYLGGSNNEEGLGIAVDAAGHAYVTGRTSSSDFPVLGWQTTYKGNSDGFVVKLSPAGNQLVYATYLGGTGQENVAPALYAGIAVDAEGHAYVTGTTASRDFPVANALQPNLNDNPNDNFVYSDAYLAKLSPDGMTLVYSTYLGGNANDRGRSLALDASGNVYVTGETVSSDFPLVNPIRAQRGSNDSFLAKLNAAGNQLVYSTFVGASSRAVTIDAAGNAYLTGQVSNSNGNVMMAKVNADGSAFLYYGHFGGNAGDYGNAIAVDTNGAAYVTGYSSYDPFDLFPRVDAWQQAQGNNGDAFVVKLNPEGTRFVYASLLGGQGGDEGFGIVVDAIGNAYVAGKTESNNFPTVKAPQTSNRGSTEAFITRIAPGVPPTGATVVSVSAASYSTTAPVTAESIVSAFGTGLATETRAAEVLPLPLELVGTSVKIRDSQGLERMASLFYVSPNQINYQVPPGMATGLATVTVTTDRGSATGTLQISNVAPALFSANANGREVAAGYAVRVRNGLQRTEPIAQWDASLKKMVPVALDLGPSTDEVFLTLFGTGFRTRSALSAVTVRIGGINAEVHYAGPQGYYIGLDQLNVRVPRGLTNCNLRDIVLTVDGQTANIVQATIKAEGSVCGPRQ
jgi:uncharacterized protein (TIGR03437 family)